jgi:putative endonuclease
MKQCCVYILASQKNGTIYTGVTSNLPQRIEAHKDDCSIFTKKYRVHQLVYYELIDDVEIAIKREKQIKHYKRDWKLQLIEQVNPNWDDLSQDFFV